MGEVYRADDLKLGQPVALKFLPRAVERDSNRLDRFLNEVKTALRVTHPNVCRVYDIGEVEGQHYLSMEYVDGENLASLLRRIGRLPEDKAVQIARQLCAGLQAAHEQGILHRDLKPANVMIDGRGRAKITDFGLANLAEIIEGDEVRAGTPTYMAPEQLAGREVTVWSDIYSLGLLLYELFTGKKPFEAQTPQEMARLQETSAPTSPSSHISGLDPAVERVILRCLERDARQRPADALAVAAALPGGDPLAAALAAGETPSPEMVADAGESGGLRPVLGIIFLSIIILGLIVQAVFYDWQYIVGRISLEKPPEALTITAREIVERAGCDASPTDNAYGFEYDNDYIEMVRAQEPSPEQWNDLETIRPAPIYFWYRQSPQYLVASDLLGSAPYFVKPDRPPRNVPGMVGVWLDPQGRLLRFEAVPPAMDDSSTESAEVDWSGFFVAAGLDVAGLTPTTPQLNPLLDCDDRLAWEGVFSDQPEVPIRVEAGSYRGRAAYFEIVPLWRQRGLTTSKRSDSLVEDLFFFAMLVLLLVGGSLLARRNVRLGRGDRRSAFRLCVFIFLSYSLWWILDTHHVPTFGELWLFFNLMGFNLVMCGMVWIVYVALEPYARRMWPNGMISWNRLLAGRLRDPLIGRDVLIGALAGVAVRTWWQLYHLLRSWLSLPDEPLARSLQALTGVRHALAAIVVNFTDSLLFPIGWLLLLLLLRALVRNQWLAAVIAASALSLAFAAGGTYPPLYYFFVFVAFLAFLVVLLRYGILASFFGMVFMYIGSKVALTADPSSWYAGRSLFTLLVMAGIAVYAFYISLAGRQLFKGEALGR
jgi:serine/threonine-protein kinase